MASRGPVHEVGPGGGHPQGQSSGDPLGHADDVGHDAEVLDAEPLPGPSYPRLHLVHREEDAVLVEELLQLGEVALRRNDVAPLALDGLGEDHRHLLGRDVLVEEVVVDVADASETAVGALQVEGAAVAVGVEDVLDARDEGGEVAPLGGLARGEADGAHRPPVEGTDVGEDPLPLRVPPGELDRSLHRLGAAVPVVELLLEVAGDEVVEGLAEVHVVLVVEVGVGVVEEPVGLLLDRSGDPRVVVADAANRQARVHVDELVPVDVGDDASLAGFDDEGVDPPEGGGDDGVVPLDDLPCLRPRWCDNYLGITQFVTSLVPVSFP